MRKVRGPGDETITGPTRAGVYRLLRSVPFSKKGCKSAAELRKPSHGQPYHVEVVAFDPCDEHSAAALDRVAAGPSAPFLRGQVPVQQRLVELVEGHPRALDRRLLADHDAADDLVRAPAQRPQRRARRSGV